MNDPILQRLDKSHAKMQRDLDKAYEEREKKEQAQAEREGRGVAATEQSNVINKHLLKIDKRTYCLTVYIAIVTTIAAIPAVILFVQWLSKILQGDPSAP